jgi:hypothetical protein
VRIKNNQNNVFDFETRRKKRVNKQALSRETKPIPWIRINQTGE